MFVWVIYMLCYMMTVSNERKYENSILKNTAPCSNKTIFNRNVKTTSKNISCPSNKTG
jgi:hypothetical protein